MLTPIANTHRHKLPRPGAIVVVATQALQPGRRYRRFIVESYPLSDSPDQRYSRGIHTCTLRALDNEERCRVSGVWCLEADEL